MLTAFESLWTQMGDALALVPESIVAALIFAISIITALLVARLGDIVLRRAFAVGHPYLYSLLLRLEGPLRLALVLLALNIATAAAPLDPDLAAVLGYPLRVAFIAMIGWMVLSAVNIVSDIYLRRFDIATADNLLARKQVTQVRILKGAVNTLIITVTVAVALMTFDAVRQFGVSLFASAGIAGIIVGLAARPMLSNLIAGLQLAITQPIRLDDAVIVENEWGWIEEITATYVVVRLWDWRRLIVPLTYFIEKPFQNWTRESASLIGVVMLRLDFSAPIERIRAKAEGLVRASKLWDGRVFRVQVTDADHRTMEVRVLASAATSGATFDLRCDLREKLITFLASDCPDALPRARQEFWEKAEKQHGTVEQKPEKVEQLRGDSLGTPRDGERRFARGGG
jgi:small-conductance mechanosensitive channel